MSRDQNSQHDGVPGGFWARWSTPSGALLISLFLVLSTGIFILAGAQESSKTLTMLAVLVFFAFASTVLWKLPGRTMPPPVRALLSSVSMIALVLTTDILCPAPGIPVLLILPGINAALRLGRKGTFAILVLVALAWLLLRSGYGSPDSAELLYTLAELIPLVLIVLLVRNQSREIDSVQSRISDLSVQDELTGLLNMTAFSDLMAIEHQKSAEQKSSYALLRIDIDGLKSINEQHGHDQGDRVIAAVADALKRSTRSNDLIARYGGDEFVMAVIGADDKIAQEVSNRVSQNVYNTTLSFERKMQRLVVHIGISIYPDSGSTVQDMMVFADQAMYRDKDFRRRVKHDTP